MLKIVILFLNLALAQNAPDLASHSLEAALMGDLGPACKLKGKYYLMEDDIEGICTERGGTVVIVPRKNLAQLQVTRPREKLEFKPRDGRAGHAPYGYKGNPYDHTQTQ